MPQRNKTRQNSDALEDEALRERLAQVLGNDSVRGLARRLELPFPTVGRYIKDGRPPASFCRKLVRELGVNPAWLLTGEGSPMLSDVPQVASNTATGLLELVEAMNAVAKMRLGALAGKEHLKVLRELNEALNRYEELRAKLNKHSRPVFRMLVDQLIAIQEERNPDKARPLLEACRQVARLCDDPVLERDYIYHRSHYAYLAGNARESTRLLRRLVSQILIEGERLGDELDHAGCLWAQNLAASLRLQLQIPEASQIAEASLLFVPAAVRKTPGYHALLMQAALGDIELGRLRRARERLTRLLPDIAEGNYRAFMALPFLALANALSGSAGFEEAKVSCAHDATHILALIAMWNENGAQLDETVTLGGHYRGPATPVFAHTALFVSAVTRARRGERLTTLLGTVDDSLAKFAGHESLEEYRTYVAPVVKTQCALLAGDHKRAMTLFLQANDALRAAPRGISLPVVYAALHHRNAIRLSAGPAGTSGSRRKALKHAREQALKFFRRHIKAGYAVFRSALEETRAPA